MIELLLKIQCNKLPYLSVEILSAVQETINASKDMVYIALDALQWGQSKGYKSKAIGDELYLFYVYIHFYSTSNFERAPTFMHRTYKIMHVSCS